MMEGFLVEDCGFRFDRGLGYIEKVEGNEI